MSWLSDLEYQHRTDLVVVVVAVYCTAAGEASGAVQVPGAVPVPGAAQAVVVGGF